MTLLLREADPMGRKKVEPAVNPNPKPMGPTLAKNLHRLGYGDIVIRVSDVAAKVKKPKGGTLSRQRLSALLNAVRIERETLEMIAKGLGVKVDELTRDD